MKKLYTLLLAFIFLMAAYAQEGIKFDPNVDANFSENQVIHVPASPIHSQVVFSAERDSVTVLDGYGKPMGFAPAKEDHDFIGITADGQYYWITVNHESTVRDAKIGDGGGMTTFKLKWFNDEEVGAVATELPDGRLGKFHNVDFANTVGETWTNCGGMISSTGRIWTAEEYPLVTSWGQGNKDVKSFLPDTGDVIIGEGILRPFHVENQLDEFNGRRLRKFESQGWMVEIDPRTGKALQKQYNWGRMSFEAACMTDDQSAVYMTEDERPGIFTKFVPDTPGDFTEGKLYVFDQNNIYGADGHWMEVDNSDLTTMINLKDTAWVHKATYFIRLEWLVNVNDTIYICETGYDNVCKDPHWTGAIAIAGGPAVVAAHHHERASTQPHLDSQGYVTAVLGTQFTVNDSSHYRDFYGRILMYDPVLDTVTVLLEGGPDYDTAQSQAIADYPAKHLSNPDGLGVFKQGGKTYLVINEDLNGSSHNRLPGDAGGWFCEMYLLDLSIDNPTIDDLIRIGVGPNGSELTGGNGTPDGKTILVDVQHPSAGNAVMKNASTVELTGFDQVADLASLNFDTDFTDGSDFQRPTAAEIHYQVLFEAFEDSVTVLDHYMQPNGKAPAKEDHDFIGISPDGDDYWISVNHESTVIDPLIGDGGGMTSFKVTRGVDDVFEVVETTLPDGRVGKYHNVDFANTVGETWTNCGGMIGPDGRIWTAEEYPLVKSWGQGNSNITGAVADTGDVIIGEGVIIPCFNDGSDQVDFEGERIRRYESQGWMVEIDPKTGKAIRKQYNWGRMSFEAACMMPDNKTVYMAEDERPGLFTKFVADEANDFTSGKLYVFDQNTTGPDGHWLEMDNTDLTTMVNLKDTAWTMGATLFIRLEWLTEVDGKIYIAETGFDNICSDPHWTDAVAIAGEDAIAAHHVARAAAQKHLNASGDVVDGALGTQFTVNDTSHYYDFYGRILVYDPATDEVSVHLEGGPDYPMKVSQPSAEYPAKHLSNMDGLGQITVHGKTYLIIQEDLNGATYNRVPMDASSKICEMYLLDATIENPTIDDLTRIMVGPNGAELTGGNGTPDGKIILVDIQHPSPGNTPPFDRAVTVAMTGWDKQDPTVSMEDLFENSWDDFVVYPNPVYRTLYFKGSFDVQLFDMSGKLVKEKRNAEHLNVSELPSGMYILRNSYGDSKKVIIE